MADEDALAALGKIGIRPFTAAQGVEALGYLLGTDATQITVANMEWAKFKPAFEPTASGRFLDSIHAHADGSRRHGGRSAIATELEQADSAHRRKILAAHLQREIAALLGLSPPTAPPPRQGFFAMGMDSIMAVELRRRLEESFDRAVPATVAFDYPNILALTEFLMELLGYAAVDVSAGEPQRAAPEDSAVYESELERSIAERLDKLEALTRREGGGARW
jgi:acyl carrier protein